MTSPARTTSMEPGLDTPATRSRSKAKDEGTLDMFAGVTHVVEVRAHLRTVPGPPAPSGEERRDDALAKMEARDPVQAALVYAREKLVLIFKSRQKYMATEKHYCTADDADKVWREWSDFPAELRDANANWKGATFLSKGWKRIAGRTVRSTRDRMHCTDLALWRWEGE